MLKDARLDSMEKQSKQTRLFSANKKNSHLGGKKTHSGNNQMIIQQTLFLNSTELKKQQKKNLETWEMTFHMF